jgi:CDP-diacylglycerol--glycerol-3-phosphate 3-phosphatidyltransferase/cardiolipin synthase
METYSLRHLLAGPTLLSLARLPLGVAFVFALGHGPWPWIALIASAITDVLDGWYARRTGQVTKTGAMVDGIMDKVFVLIVVLALILTWRLSLVETLELGTREAGELMIAAWLMATRRERLAASHRAQPLGKLTTVLQYLTIGSAIAGWPMTASLALLTAVAGALAAAAYFRDEAEAVTP